MGWRAGLGQASSHDSSEGGGIGSDGKKDRAEMTDNSTGLLVSLARRFLSDNTRRNIVGLQRRYGLQWPRTGAVNFASLRRLTPISPIFGMERGRPIDRYYIEAFLETYRTDIRGRALELGDASYIRRFGDGRVTHIDVLSYVPGGDETTIVADLTHCPHIPDATFDCIIFTQALQMILDMPAALRELYRILKPGGCVLLTTHGTSKIARRLGRDDWGEYWRLTAQGLQALVGHIIPEAQNDIHVYGNVLSASAFLYGLAVEDLSPRELDVNDPDFEVIVAGRIRKPSTHESHVS